MRETNFSGVRGIQLPCGLAVVASAFALQSEERSQQEHQINAAPWCLRFLGKLDYIPVIF
jgi:hypothetical protein